MFPGSLPTLGMQIAATERHESVCENDEEYGQRYGRVSRSAWLAGLILAAIAIFFLVTG